MPTLHVLVDSKEQSISAARLHYSKLPSSYEIQARHIRHADFVKVFLKLFHKKNSKDQILISMDFIGEEKLEAATAKLPPDLKNTGKNYPKVTLFSYGCFDYITKWCEMHGFLFEENPYERRDLKKKERETISNYLKSKDTVLEPKNSQDSDDVEDAKIALERIWSQYRLMRAIMSNSELLDDVAGQLIKSQPMPGNSLKDEFNRAFQYFKLREPDMVGGTYFSEQESNTEKRNVIDQMRERIRKIAVTNNNVLIEGESGSGKESVAWAIHELSKRRDKPFHTLNCSSFEDHLLESELFGYEKGAFTGANKRHDGILMQADGGTIFLDELPNMSLRVQAKLLRLLESGEFRRLGAKGENLHADVRIIGAGQGRLLRKSKWIRVDLQARIAQLTIELFPLRELEKKMPGTLVKIANALLERSTWTTIDQEGVPYKLTPKDIRKYRDKLGKDSEKKQLLENTGWKKSNVRELKNFITHWITLGESEFNRLSKENRTVEGNKTQTTEISNSSTTIEHQKFSQYLAQVSSKDDLKKLFESRPFKEITIAYAQYIWDLYERIVAQENSSGKNNARATRKELAGLIGLKEHTFGRYLKG